MKGLAYVGGVLLSLACWYVLVRAILHYVTG